MCSLGSHQLLLMRSANRLRGWEKCLASVQSAAGGTRSSYLWTPKPHCLLGSVRAANASVDAFPSSPSGSGSSPGRHFAGLAHQRRAMRERMGSGSRRRVFALGAPMQAFEVNIVKMREPRPPPLRRRRAAQDARKGKNVARQLPRPAAGPACSPGDDLRRCEWSSPLAAALLPPPHRDVSSISATRGPRPPQARAGRRQSMYVAGRFLGIRRRPVVVL